ncbi:MAG: GNAT family N-acetyltransferase [Candidatus Kapabacteria bacterium]|nr:GNAT family N-acetyltransferase [Candidatus Kapabacteria bacterium]
MNNTNFSEIVDKGLSPYLDKLPKSISKFISFLLHKILYVNEMTKFIQSHQSRRGLDMIEDFLEYLDFSYTISDKDKRRIPAEGKLICVSNHPLGGLDGLVLLQTIGEVRKDVKILANGILANIEAISGNFIPIEMYSNGPKRSQLESIKKCLENEEAIIIFPAGEVSRMSGLGIKDKDWSRSALYFASKYNAPILPMFVKGRNSLLFYFTSIISKKLAMFLLPSEMFNKKGKTIHIRVGDPIPAKVFSSGVVNQNYMIKLLKKHTFNIGKKKDGIFKTEKTIIHPVETKVLRQELFNSQLLSKTSDNKMIFLVSYDSAQNLMKELARLREFTFRKVGEGTGERYDSDKYDKIYKHLVLWDDNNLDIIGSYRIGICDEIIKSNGVSAIYNQSQFNFDDAFLEIMKNSIELGRSFIQHKYWKTNALDLLWKGLGAYISENQNIRYLWGAVSISDFYSDEAKSLIIYYYNKWYGTSTYQTKAKYPYIITKNRHSELVEIFSEDSYDKDFKVLKNSLKNLGYTVPILYRSYTELCEKGGTEFIDFGVDESFANSIDGLILLDLSKLETSKKERYLREMTVN